MYNINQKRFVPSYREDGTIGEVTSRETGVTYTRGDQVRVGPGKIVTIEEFIVLGDTMFTNEGQIYDLILCEKL